LGIARVRSQQKYEKKCGDSRPRLFGERSSSVREVGKGTISVIDGKVRFCVVLKGRLLAAPQVVQNEDGFSR
jgi:hypothetical protein